MAVVAFLAVLLAAGCTQPSGSSGSGPGPGGSHGVNPKDTDAAITDDPIFTHLAFTPTTTARNELVLLFHGTGASPQGLTELANALRTDGYHVIALRYAAGTGTGSACPDANYATDPDCHRLFRSEAVFGGGVTDPDGQTYDHPLVYVTPAGSVVNRLVKLLDYLVVNFPTEGWEQFQQQTGGVCDVPSSYGACEPAWTKISALGHSQGAGIAIYLAKFYALDHVGMLSGSYEGYYLPGGGFQLAPWITEGGLDVPGSDMGSLMHTADYGRDLFREVHAALGLPGPEVDVVAGDPPYGGSTRLITSATPTCPWDGVPGHNSTAVDACAPDYLYYDAWRYLAGS